MANSLQDQLLKAGLANKKQAQKINSQRRKKQKQINKGAVMTEDPATEQARITKAEQIARDRELNLQKQSELNSKAIKAQIQQLVSVNRLDRSEGELPYNFVDGQSIKKIYVTEEIHTRLGQGFLSIIKLTNDYEVVPSVVADKIAQRDSSVIISQSQTDTKNDENDPYAEFQVPDDLMW